MYRDCLRCGFTLPAGEFPNVIGGLSSTCHECARANPAVHRVAALAADGILRCRAIHALLTIGFSRLAREIAGGLTAWPDLWRGYVTRLWWISFDGDTLAILRMLLGGSTLDCKPVAMPVAA